MAFFIPKVKTSSRPAAPTTSVAWSLWANSSTRRTLPRLAYSNAPAWSFLRDPPSRTLSTFNTWRLAKAGQIMIFLSALVHIARTINNHITQRQRRGRVYPFPEATCDSIEAKLPLVNVEATSGELLATRNELFHVAWILLAWVISARVLATDLNPSEDQLLITAVRSTALARECYPFQQYLYAPLTDWWDISKTIGVVFTIDHEPEPADLLTARGARCGDLIHILHDNPASPPAELQDPESPSLPSPDPYVQSENELSPSGS